MLKVEAMDGDRGINDPVIYSISSENGMSPGWGWGKGRGGEFRQSHRKELLLLLLPRFHKAWLV